MIATQFSALNYLQNWRTRIVYFFITPLIDLLLLVLIDMQYAGNFNWSIAVASIAVDAAGLSMQTMDQLIIDDSVLRIDYELIAKRPFSFRYWMSKGLVSFIIGAILALINLLIIFCFGAPVEIIARALALLPLLCLYGIVFGFTSWAISWQMNDPYFLQNIISGSLQLISGILVVISAYPDWLKVIAMLFPFSGPVAFIKNGSTDLLTGIFITAIWLLIGIFAYIMQIKPVLQKGKHRY